MLSTATLSTATFSTTTLSTTTLSRHAQHSYARHGHTQPATRSTATLRATLSTTTLIHLPESSALSYYGRLRLARVAQSSGRGESYRITLLVVPRYITACELDRLLRYEQPAWATGSIPCRTSFLAASHTMPKGGRVGDPACAPVRMRRGAP